MSSCGFERLTRDSTHLVQHNLSDVNGSVTEVHSLNDTNEPEVNCAEVLRRLWAKDPHDAAEGLRPYAVTPHLIDTAAIIESLWWSWLRPGLRELISEALDLPESEAVKYVMLMAGTHDVGKISGQFLFKPHDAVRGGHDRSAAWRAAVRESLAEVDPRITPPNPISRTGGDDGTIARRHEVVTGYALRRHVAATKPEIGSPHWASGSAVDDCWIAAAGAGHHGTWRTAGFNSVENVEKAALDPYVTAQIELIEGALEVQLSGAPALSGKRRRAAFLLLSGLLILADWLASSDDFVGRGKQMIRAGADPVGDPADWLVRRRRAARRHIEATIGLMNPAEFDQVCRIATGGHDLRPLQRQVSDLGAGRGLVVVAYPTGEGKTITAELRHAREPEERLIFALPTVATTDAMARTLRDHQHDLGNPVRKANQMAAFTQMEGVSQRDSELYSSTWHTNSIRNLLAPIAAVTCDQVLMGSLKRRRTTLRLLALANAHVVLDEVHTYDVYQRRLVTDILSWLAVTDTRVTMLSASFPTDAVRSYRETWAKAVDRSDSHDEGYLQNYPAHDHFDPLRSISTVAAIEGPLSADVEPIWLTPLRTPSANSAAARTGWVRDRIAEAPRSHIAVIANRVDEVIRTAMKLRAAGVEQTHELVVLHSRMVAKRRGEIESMLVRRLGPPPTEPVELEEYVTQRPLLVVATQIIEASLDLDFDHMLSDLAPAPSLVQRAGRLWRFRDPQHRLHRLGSTQANRDMSVLVTNDDAGDVPLRDEAPYLGVELVRTLAAMDGLHSSGEPLRVPEGVQDFVDAAAPDMAQLLAAGNAIDAAMARRTADALSDYAVKTSAADGVRAKLDRVVGMGNRGALKYGALGELTAVDISDEEMGGTRYEDGPSKRVIVFDSGDLPSPSAHPIAPGPWLTGLSPRQVDFAEQMKALQMHSLPVSGHALNEAEDLHEATVSRWIPGGWDEKTVRSQMLADQLIVDLALVGEPTPRYDELLGWIPSRGSDQEQSSLRERYDGARSR